MGIIGALIAVIITIILVGVLWWAINALLPLIPLPPPFRQIVNVLLTVILVLIVLWVILWLFGIVGVNVPIYHGMR